MAAMRHAWDSYVTYAWGHDELDPIAKRGKDGFGGLGATVISPQWLRQQITSRKTSARNVRRPRVL